jgi:beta-lactamase regulating signal transducer with metallopeptidase domain
MTGLVAFANELAGEWSGWMWAAVWQSSVLGLLVFLVTRRLRRASALVRFWLWMLVPLRLLVMPVLTVPIPALPPYAPVPVAVSGAAAEEESLDVFAATAPAEEAALPRSALNPGTVQSDGPRVRVSTCVMAVWLAGMALCGLRTALAWRRMRRTVAGARQVTDGPLLAMVAEAAHMLGMPKPPRVVVTPGPVPPFACGIRRPTVVLSSPFLAGVGEPGLRAVLAHECAHLHRRDSMMGVILAVCEAVYFFHPIVHLAKRRILLERERACDDFVLANRGTNPSDYAKALLAAAGLCGTLNGQVGPPVIAAESFSDLRLRLLTMASRLTPNARLSRGTLATLVLLGVLCVPGIALTARQAEQRDDFDERVDASTTTARAAGAPRGRARAATTETRTILFPAERSLGTISIESRPDTRQYVFGSWDPLQGEREEWTFVAAAQGEVRVPKGKRVRLQISEDGLTDLSPLAQLDSNDIQEVYIYLPRGVTVDADTALMPYLAGLTGLETFRASGCAFTGAGLRHLEGMRQLRELYLYTAADAQRLDDEAMGLIAGLEPLEVLYLSGQVTDEGVRHLTKLESLRELRIDASRIRGPGLAHLGESGSLQLLELSGKGFGDEGLEHVKQILSLKCLKLGRGIEISDDGLAHLSDLHGLEELEVRGNAITDAGIAHLRDLRSLKRLWLYTDNVTGEGLAHLTVLDALEDLTLPHGGVTDAGLAHVAKLGALRRLDAGGSTRPREGGPAPYTDEALRHLSALKRLEKLRIGLGKGCTDGGVVHLAELTALKDLTLMTDGISDSGLASLATLTSLQSLSLIAPEACNLTVSGVSQLNAVTALKTLHVNRILQDGSGLDLSGLTQLTHLGISITDGPGRKANGALRDEDVASLAGLVELRGLQLGRGTGFGDAGMAHLVKLTALEHLNIGGGRVTDQGLQYLADMGALASLTLQGDITDAGLRYLESVDGLRSLRIESEHEFSESAEARLREALPGLVGFNEPMMARAAAGG